MTSPDTAMTRSPAGNDRPLRADAERNRERLLEAARAVFAERGLDASMDEIAAHAGVGVGTAYRRFANKEEVITALFELRLDAIVAMARTCAETPVAWEGLVRFLEQTCEAMAQDRGFRDILLRDGSESRKRIGIRERLTPILEELVERAQAAGDLRADVTARDLPMVVLMMEAVSDATDRIDPNLSRRYLALVLDGLRPQARAALMLPGTPLTNEQTEQAFARRHTRR